MQYRHLLVVKGGNKQLDCTPPHDVPLKPFAPLMVKPLTSEAEETAACINNLILRSQELLANHPVNLARVQQAKTLPTASGRGAPATVRRWCA